MVLKGSKRVYSSTVFNWMLKNWKFTSSVSVTSLLLIGFLVSTGSIVLFDSSGDLVCSGLSNDLCVARVSFLAKTDVYVYPGDDWGLATDKPIKNLKLYRTWGKGANIDSVRSGSLKGLRQIDLSKKCDGSWCGGKNGVESAYAFVFRAGNSYTLFYTAEKERVSDTIKWSFGVDENGKVLEWVDPKWLADEVGCSDEVIVHGDNCVDPNDMDSCSITLFQNCEEGKCEKDFVVSKKKCEDFFATKGVRK